MKKLMPLLLIIFLQATHGQVSKDISNNPFRIWLQPQLGISGGGLGAGAEIDVAYKYLVIGARTQANTNLCIFCTIENRVQQNLLVGFSTGLSGSGSISLLTGISRFSGHKKGNYEEPDGFLDWGDGYEQISYEGSGLPLQLNMNFGRSAAGFGITGFADINKENPTGGVFIGLPLGNFSG